MLLGLLFFLILIFLFIFLVNNTPFLRKQVINGLLPIINSSLIAKIEIEDIKFKNFNAVVVRHFRLITSGDTLAQFSELDLKVKLSELWNNKIVIRNLTIKNPVIKLLRNPIDSIWNYNLIAPPSTDDTPPGKSPIIRIYNFKLTNGQLKYHDPFYRDSSLAFNPMDLELHNLNIHLKTDLDFDNNSIYARVHKISFDEKHTQLRIDSLKFAANLSKNYTKLDYLELFSDNSKINFSAELINFNPLNNKKYYDIEKAKINSRIQLQDISTDLPLKFLYLPFNNNQAVNAKLTANGSIKKIDVAIQYVNYRNTKIFGNASVWFDNDYNVHYSADIQNSVVYQQDVDEFLNIDLSAVPKYEIAQIQKIEAVGTDKQVQVSGKISTLAGNVEMQSKVVFYPHIEYSLNSKLNNINLAKLFNNNELLSNISGSVQVFGSGDDFNRNLYVNSNASINNSTFKNIFINNSEIKIALDKGKVTIDSFFVSFPSVVDTLIGVIYPSSINVGGGIDFTDFNNPQYEIDLAALNLNLSKLVNNNSLPSNITFNSKILGKSLDINKLQLSAVMILEEVTFSDITFLPFKLEFNLKDNGDNLKSISLNFMKDTVSIIGKMNFNELNSKLPKIIDYSFLYFQSRYNEFFWRKTDSIRLSEMRKLGRIIQLPEIDATVQLKFNNFFFLNSFLKDISIHSSMNWEGIIRSFSDNAFIDFSHSKIGNTRISTSGFELDLDEFTTNFSLNISKNDTTINLTFGNLNIEDLEKISFNKIIITQPKFNFLSLDNKFVAEFGLKYDTLLTTFLEIDGEILRNSISFVLPKFEIGLFNNLVSFRNQNKPQIGLDVDGIRVENLDLIGKNDELIYIDADLHQNTITNTKFRFGNFKFSNYTSLFKQFQLEELQKSQFNLNFLEFNAYGKIDNPSYNIELLIDTAKVMGTDFGRITSNITYIDSNITGQVELKEKSAKIISPLIFRIISFPYNLSLTDRFGTFSGSYLARLELDTFRLGVIDPFLPIVRNLQGNANGYVDIVGTDFENYNLNGKLQTNNTNFIFELNNLPYTLAANITLKDNIVRFDTLKVKNYGLQSLAELIGWMKIENNQLAYMDLNSKASNFIILDDVSKKKLPQFYGKLSVNTKNDGLIIRGNPNNLNITGDVQINPSNLVIANLDQIQQTTKTNFEYRLVGDKKVITLNTTSDTTQKPKETKQKISAQMPNVEMNVFIPKTVNLTIDLGPIGEVVAILGSSDPSIPLVYVMDKDNPMGQLNGELVIKDGSTLNSYKRMNAKGSISFQSRDITNPFIDIVGEYNGKIDDQNNPIRYSIAIYITGTAQQPKVRFDYTLNGVSPRAEQKKIEENALYLLLFGQLPGSGDAMLDPNVVNKLSSAGISSVASRSISDLLLRTGVIESADFQIDSQDFEKTKINFKGKLYGSLNWSLGGSIADLTKNNQITIEMPISTDSKLFNQIIWMLSYSTNLNSTVFDPDEKNWEMKLKFGGSW